MSCHLRVIYHINLTQFYIKLNQFVLNKCNTKNPVNKPFFVISAYLLDFCFGGDEGNRTPVRKVFAKAFYERSCRFKIPLPQHPTTGYTAR